MEAEMTRCWVCGEQFRRSEMHVETDYEGIPRLLCPYDVLTDLRDVLRETAEFFMETDLATGKDPFAGLRNTVWQSRLTNQKGTD